MRLIFLISALFCLTGAARAQSIATGWDLAVTNQTVWQDASAVDSFTVSTSVNNVLGSFSGVYIVEAGGVMDGGVVGVWTVGAFPATTNGYGRIAATSGVPDIKWRLRWSPDGMGIASSGTGAAVVSVRRSSR